MFVLKILGLFLCIGSGSQQCTFNLSGSIFEFDTEGNEIFVTKEKWNGPATNDMLVTDWTGNEEHISRTLDGSNNSIVFLPTNEVRCLFKILITFLSRYQKEYSIFMEKFDNVSALIHL